MILPSLASQAAPKSFTPSVTSPMMVPSAPKTRAPIGSNQTRVLFLNNCHCSAKSIVSSPAPRMLSEVCPAALPISSRFSAPDFRAPMNCVAPRVPNTLDASSSAAASSPFSTNPAISPCTRWNASAGSSPSLARVTRPLDIDAMICELFRPALSKEPTIAVVSSNENPRVSIAGAFREAASASSFIPMPVA